MKHTLKPVRSLSVTLATIGALSLFSLPSQAAVVIGNLPQDNDDLASVDLNASRRKAVVFTTGSQAFLVDNVILRLGNYDTDDDVALVGFFLDNGIGSNTGSQVGNFLQAPVSSSNAIANFTFSPVGSLTLEANTRYWLLVYSSDSLSAFDWRLSSPSLSPVGTGATFDFARFSSNSGVSYSNSNQFNSFQINGTVVPEPSSVLLLGLGALGLAARRRRIK